MIKFVADNKAVVNIQAIQCMAKIDKLGRYIKEPYALEYQFENSSFQVWYDNKNERDETYNRIVTLLVRQFG